MNDLMRFHSVPHALYAGLAAMGYILPREILDIAPIEARVPGPTKGPGITDRKVRQWLVLNEPDKTGERDAATTGEGGEKESRERNVA